MAVRFEKLRIWAILNNTHSCEQFLNKAQAEISLVQRASIVSRLPKYMWRLQAVQTLFASKGLHLPNYSWAADFCSKLRSKSGTSLALNTFRVHVLCLPAPFTKSHPDNPLQCSQWGDFAGISSLVIYRMLFSPTQTSLAVQVPCYLCLFLCF